MIRLHHVHQARSMRTLWLLREMGLDCEVKTYDFFNRSLRDPEFLKISPAGRVPALEIDGLVMFESGAIAEYLCETRPGFGLGREPGHPERADWLEWLHFAETVAQHCASLTQQHIALFEDWMRSPTVMKLERKRLEKTLEALEARLARHDYILPSGFSAVDINNAYGVYVAKRFISLEPFPSVRRWFEALEGRQAYRDSFSGAPSTLYAKEFYEQPDA